ncbi:MAG: thiamine-phosphate kinase [Methanomicrobiales archaeon]|nr:thiamine-phosphate kinase [Methanomicrobiales archaeon]
MDERSLLQQLSKILAQDVTSDDCAVIEHGGEYLVLTTDMLHEKADFPAGMNEWQIGWMSAAVTISDIAAMGARPVALLIAAGLDRAERLIPIVTGARACCTKYGADIAGGDIDSHGELTLVTTGIGMVERELCVRRRGSQPGDAICVTGPLGLAEAALRGETRYLPHLLEPQPRVDEGRAIAKAGATAMMDISDGLALSLHDMCQVNPVGYRVHSHAIPIPEGIPRSEALEMALIGGGDFELLFTIPEKNLPLLPIAYYRIGEVIEAHGVFLDEAPLSARGYEHTWEN